MQPPPPQSWVTDFATAAEKVSASPSAEALVSKLTALKTATDSGDVSASKRSYIELVGELQAWAASSSLTNSLKGL
ncbi:thylakoid lumenal protein [Haematococcus lacustris]|uniref:Thylakoid lumenal protein n=1 Tax=Haematococcus lacustris TaxID=44745 RepID=A0A699YQT9_HAELA|nr:thylakoid lumenal protein [Haematococcus lacustris]